jgi:hypothetical protein
MPKRKVKETASDSKMSPLRKEKSPAKPKGRLRLNRREEQAILSRFSTGEGFREVQERYRDEVRDEIRNLKNAFDAGEFEFKAGVWLLVS